MRANKSEIETFLRSEIKGEEEKEETDDSDERDLSPNEETREDVAQNVAVTNVGD